MKDKMVFLEYTNFLIQCTVVVGEMNMLNMQCLECSYYGPLGNHIHKLQLLFIRVKA